MCGDGRGEVLGLLGVRAAHAHVSVWGAGRLVRVHLARRQDAAGAGLPRGVRAGFREGVRLHVLHDSRPTSTLPHHHGRCAASGPSAGRCGGPTACQSTTPSAVLQGDEGATRVAVAPGPGPRLRPQRRRLRRPPRRSERREQSERRARRSHSAHALPGLLGRGRRDVGVQPPAGAPGEPSRAVRRARALEPDEASCSHAHRCAAAATQGAPTGSGGCSTWWSAACALARTSPASSRALRRARCTWPRSCSWPLRR